jgi:hypothetical protein
VTVTFLVGVQAAVAGNLGTTWKPEAPDTAGVHVSEDEAIAGFRNAVRCD